MHARALMLSAATALGLAALATSLPSHAQGALKPVDAMIVNPPSRPVPVTGTVKLDGGAGGITGTLKSGDKNVTAFEQFIDVTSPTGGNHGTGQVDVSDFKEVRVSVSRSSCGPCSQILVAVFGITALGKSFQMDEFVANQGAGDAFPWASRTYSVPGSKLHVSLRAAEGGTWNSVQVTVVGRAN
jgi:hypothetical protein